MSRTPEFIPHVDGPAQFEDETQSRNAQHFIAIASAIGQWTLKQPKGFDQGFRIASWVEDEKPQTSAWALALSEVHSEPSLGLAVMSTTLIEVDLNTHQVKGDAAVLPIHVHDATDPQVRPSLEIYDLVQMKFARNLIGKIHGDIRADHFKGDLHPGVGAAIALASLDTLAARDFDARLVETADLLRAYRLEI